MAHHLELHWIDPLNAQVSNRTGRAVFDVKLNVTGSVTVEGQTHWNCTTEKLADGESINMHQIKKDVGWATALPFLEMTWREADSTGDSFKRVLLHHI